MMAAPSKPGRASFYLRLGGTLLTLALLAWLLYKQGWQSILGAFAKIPVGLLALAFLLTCLSRLAVVLRWHLLLRSAGEKATLGQTARLTFAGLFASNYLPTTVGGDVVRLAGAVQLRLDGAISAASLVMDRLVGMAGMATLLPWGLARLFAVGLDFSQGLSVPVMAATVWWKRERFQALRATVSRLGRRFAGAIALSARRPKALGAAYLSTLVYMVFKFTAIWLLLQGMGQPMSWWWIAGLWSMVYFITLLPLSINGYGLQEFAVTILYPRLGGISLEASLAVALLVRTMEMVASLPGALFVPGIIAASRQAPSAAAPAGK